MDGIIQLMVQACYSDRILQAQNRPRAESSIRLFDYVGGLAKLGNFKLHYSGRVG